MPIIVKANKERTFRNPPEGFWQAVCVDVVDMGLQEMTWKGHTKEVHRGRIVWQIPETFEFEDPDTHEKKTARYTISKFYTMSLHEKAELRKNLEAWRSKPFTDEELKGFDLEVLIGVNCQIGIIHRVTDNGTYANVSTIAPPPKGMKDEDKLKPLDYTRVKDRLPKDGEEHEDNGEEPGEEGDDLPF